MADAAARALARRPTTTARARSSRQAGRRPRGDVPGARRAGGPGGQLGRGAATADAVALIEDAAHSLRLALEREEAALAHQEAAALRRSQELQREFLSRLSHELRTPLTAIRGYASSLLQPDVTWDADSQQRFLGRIAAESARLGRLVDDLLDFSAIESGILRLQQRLVRHRAGARRGGRLPAPAGRVEWSTVTAQPALPPVWADHDRLEQVFVNLLDNAVRHNPPGHPGHASRREPGRARRRW